MGEHIRAVRESLHLSTQSAAEQAQISPGYLFKLESGYVGTPSPRVLHRLSEVLGINYWQLMDLAGYVVPGDHAVPAVTATVPPADPLERIAEALEELRDEVRAIRNRLESGTEELPPRADTSLAA
jgi:transcriptional regulator with XRE-family HTH domain